MPSPIVVLRCPACSAVIAMTEPTHTDWLAKIAPRQLRCGVCPDEPVLEPADRQTQQIA